MMRSIYPRPEGLRLHALRLLRWLFDVNSDLTRAVLSDRDRIRWLSMFFAKRSDEIGLVLQTLTLLASPHERAKHHLDQFFWLPCPRCLCPYGGHESPTGPHSSIPNPKRPGTGKVVCPACAAELESEQEGRT